MPCCLMALVKVFGDQSDITYTFYQLSLKFVSFEINDRIGKLIDAACPPLFLLRIYSLNYCDNQGRDKINSVVGNNKGYYL